MDELKLTSDRLAPVAAMKADVRSGFAPLTVKFTDDSKMANSWAWDFGDGGTSTEKNPTHTFAAVGKYTVKLTATNEIGTNEKVETEYINVTPLAILTGGGLLKNGNMEAKGDWIEDFLNTGTGNNPVLHGMLPIANQMLVRTDIYWSKVRLQVPACNMLFITKYINACSCAFGSAAAPAPAAPVAPIGAPVVEPAPPPPAPPLPYIRPGDSPAASICATWLAWLWS